MSLIWITKLKLKMMVQDSAVKLNRLELQQEMEMAKLKSDKGD